MPEGVKLFFALFQESIIATGNGCAPEIADVNHEREI